MRNAAAALVALVALALVAWALAQFSAATRGIEVVHTTWGSMPVTVFGPPARQDEKLPTVVIAHGFAGSQQLMQPFAVTLARNGYRAVSFDFPGHGQNPVPLPGSLREHDALLAALLGALDSAVSGARALGGSDGRVALLGHSMASDLVVREAQAHPDIVATVGVSLVYGGADMAAPRNLLALYGAAEPAMVQSFGRTLVAGLPGADGSPVTPAEVRDAVTYGRFEDGSARRLALAPGAEHISVLYNATSLRESLRWLDAAFGRPATASGAPTFIDALGPAIGALLLGIVALTWPLSVALRRVLSPDAWRDALNAYAPWQPRPIGRGAWLAVTLAPALATPLLLRVSPTSFLPILLGDYLLLHFALYGVLTLAGIGWLAQRQVLVLPAPRLPSLPMLLASLAIVLWTTLAIGVPVDRYMFNLAPAAGRSVLIAAMLVGTLAWFSADEWLTRGPGTPRLAYAASKLAFVVSLALAVSLASPQLVRE
jgi:hypothetical protein